MNSNMKRSSKNDWSKVRGKKIGQPKTAKDMDMIIVNKRIMLTVYSEMSSLDQSFGYLPNLYARWIIN